ncbi:MAG: glycosyltransferase family 2 protein [Lachnospiraceae bacterium]|nr:glycosyltransferase family 2 protein [Lachnospiraceae bacterium]
MSDQANEPLVSIIIPVYNAEKYLEESLCSVTEQSYGNLEILCVDDGSTDESPQILKKQMQKDSRIRIFSRENRGAGAARNFGMEAAKGEYLLFFDADDLLHKKMIRTLVRAMLKHGPDIILFGYDKISEGKKIRVDYSAKTLRVPMNRVISPNDISGRLFQSDHGMPWNKFYKAEFLKKAGIRFQELKNTNDEYFSRITTVSANRILFLNKVFVDYRVGDRKSLHGNANRNVLDCTYALFAIRDELIQRGVFETYRETFRELAGYIVMLKLLATDDSEAFHILAKETADNVLSCCEIEEDCLEARFQGVYRALKGKDFRKAESEINRIR